MLHLGTLNITVTNSQYFSLIDTMARMSLKAEAQRYYLGYLWWILERSEHALDQWMDGWIESGSDLDRIWVG